MHRKNLRIWKLIFIFLTYNLQLVQLDFMTEAKINESDYKRAPTATPSPTPRIRYEYNIQAITVVLLALSLSVSFSMTKSVQLVYGTSIL